MNLMKTVLAHSVAINAAYAVAPTPPLVPKSEDLLQNSNMLDSITDEDANAPISTDEMRQDAVMVVHEWADSELPTGEGFGDRLYALVAGCATDGNGDADLTDDEADYAASVADLVGDYLESKGVDAGDVEELLGADPIFGNDVAARIHDALLDKLPQGEDAMLDDADKFVSGDDDEMLDAVYKKVVAIRKGKKVRIKKRISGRVRLTAAQKGAVRKMQRKAFSGQAKMKRAKSMRLRRRVMGK